MSSFDNSPTRHPQQRQAAHPIPPPALDVNGDAEVVDICPKYASNAV
jgi:hypothetical protein